MVVAAAVAASSLLGSPTLSGPGRLTLAKHLWARIWLRFPKGLRACSAWSLRRHAGAARSSAVPSLGFIPAASARRRYRRMLESATPVAATTCPPVSRRPAGSATCGLGVNTGSHCGYYSLECAGVSPENARWYDEADTSGVLSCSRGRGRSHDSALEALDQRRLRAQGATSACRMYISGHLRTPSPSYRASRTRSTRLLLRSTTLAGRLRKPSPSLVVASFLATNARGLASGTWVWRLRSPPSMGLLRGRSRRLSLRVVYRYHFHPEWSPQHCRPARVGRRGRCGCGGGGPATPWSKDRGGGLRGVTHPGGFG